jgi:hypothetical protein
LPPVQQGRELDSLDTAGNSETEKQPVEMSFHGTPCHVELSGDLGVVASLQQQVYDLLFARTEPNSLFLHPILPFCEFASPGQVYGFTYFNFGSTHIAILWLFQLGKRKTLFPQRLAHEQPLPKAEAIVVQCRMAVSRHTSAEKMRQNTHA